LIEHILLAVVGASPTFKSIHMVSHATVLTDILVLRWYHVVDLSSLFDEERHWFLGISFHV